MIRFVLVLPATGGLARVTWVNAHSYSNCIRKKKVKETEEADTKINRVYFFFYYIMSYGDGKC